VILYKLQVLKVDTLDQSKSRWRICWISMGLEISKRRVSHREIRGFEYGWNVILRDWLGILWKIPKLRVDNLNKSRVGTSIVSTSCPSKKNPKNPRERPALEAPVVQCRSLKAQAVRLVFEARWPLTIKKGYWPGQQGGETHYRWHVVVVEGETD